MDVVDRTNQLVGKVKSPIKSGNSYSGKFEAISMPSELMELFRRYEDYANNQMLSLLDDIDFEIEGYGLKLKDSGEKMLNVQIMNGDDITFKVPARSHL
ncbi:MAG: hypothetical protein GC178_09990 [Flavobacteriales bacterium]|nr:hypothetical protein [Flavobacteriales bacterium]